MFAHRFGWTFCFRFRLLLKRVFYSFGPRAIMFTLARGSQDSVLWHELLAAAYRRFYCVCDFVFTRYVGGAPLSWPKRFLSPPSCAALSLLPLPFVRPMYPSTRLLI